MLMRILIGLFAIGVLFASCGNNCVCTADGDETVSDFAGYELLPYDDTETFFRATKYNAEGKKVEEGDVLNNAKSGAWITYDNYNTISNIDTYYKGRLQGPSFKLNRGSVTEKSYFFENNLDGEKLTYKGARIKQEENYLGGALDGKRILYYDNGKKLEEGDFVNGLREGKVIYYDQEENVKMEYTYKNGEQVGQ